MLIGEALIATRDGLIGVESVQVTPPSAGELPTSYDPAKRLFRLSDSERDAVVKAELAETMRVCVTKEILGTGIPEKPGTEGPKKPGTAIPETVEVQTLDHGQNGTMQPVARITRPQIAEFQAALELVAAHADLREDRLPEIHLQMSDLLSFFGSVTPLQPAGYRKTLDMLGSALDFGTLMVQRVKLELGCPRPELLSPQLQPVIQTPSHGSFPSGHATQAFLLAELLVQLRFPKVAAKITQALMSDGSDTQDGRRRNIEDVLKGESKSVPHIYRLAARIAINRTVAGVHYPADSAAGALLGISLARLLVARVKHRDPTETGAALGFAFAGGQYTELDPNKVPVPRNFHMQELLRLITQANQGTSVASILQVADPEPARLFGALWDKAKAEWEERWS